MNIKTLGILTFCLLGASAVRGDNLIVGGWFKGGSASSSAMSQYSMAYGDGAWAGGHNSIAVGYLAQTYAHHAATFGWGLDNTSLNSLMIGRFNISTGYSTSSYVDTDPVFVIGDGTAANARSDSFKILKNGDIFGYGRLSISPDNAANSITGVGSVGMGANLTITGAYQTVLGQYNLQATYNTTSWAAADPLLVIGNGTSTSQRSNAITVLKNGNTGIGTSTPTYKLDVDGGVRVKNGAVLVQPQGDLSMGSYVSGPQP